MDIHILHTNDVHSELQGFSRLATRLSRMRARLWEAGEPVLAFDLGDHVDRSNPLSEATDGMVNAEILSAMRYDGWVFGNNETLTIPVDLWGTLAERAGIPIFCSNLEGMAPDLNWMLGRIYAFAGVNVGVFGVTVRYEASFRALGIRALDPEKTVWSVANELRGRGADVVVLLSHLGLQADRELADAGAPVDVILGSHSHHFLDAGERRGKVVVFQAGLHARAMGHTTLRVSEGGALEGVSCELVRTSAEDDPSPEVLGAMAMYEAAASEWLNRPVGRIYEPLRHSLLGESEMVNLLADQMRAEAETELAVVNGGVINVCYAAGVVRRRDLLAACPTPMRFVQMTVRGDTLLRLFEQGLDPAVIGRQGLGFGFRGSFVGRLHVSGAVIYTETPEEDGRERVAAVELGGEALLPDRSYRVAIGEYAALSSAFSALRGLPFFYHSQTLRELLGRAVGNPDRVAAARERRYRTAQRGSAVF